MDRESRKNTRGGIPLDPSLHTAPRSLISELTLALADAGDAGWANVNAVIRPWPWAGGGAACALGEKGLGTEVVGGRLRMSDG